MSFSHSTRSLTPEERKHLEQCAKLTFDDWTWVCAPIASFAFSGYMIGNGFEWLLPQLATGNSVPSLIVFGAAIGLYVSVSFFRAFATASDAAQSDLTKNIVQIISAKDVAVIQQEEIRSEGPIFYIELDVHTVLFLWGQWIYDSHIYGADNVHISDQAKTFLNAQEQEFAFPCTEFIIHRTPNLGRVLKIETNGKPLAPIETLEHGTIPLQNLCESELLEGSFEDLKRTVLECNRILTPDSAT